MSLYHKIIWRQFAPHFAVLCTSDVQLETSRSTAKFSQPTLKETYYSLLGELHVTFYFLSLFRLRPGKWRSRDEFLWTE